MAVGRVRPTSHALHRKKLRAARKGHATMDRQRFDRLTREFATAATRRQALRAAAGGIVAGAVAVVGGEDVGAARRRCLRRQQSCRRAGDCCQKNRSICANNGIGSGKVCCGPFGSFCTQSAGCCGSTLCINNSCQ